MASHIRKIGKTTFIGKKYSTEKKTIPDDYLERYATWSVFKDKDDLGCSCEFIRNGYFQPKDTESDSPTATVLIQDGFFRGNYELPYIEIMNIECGSVFAFVGFCTEAVKNGAKEIRFRDKENNWISIKIEAFSLMDEYFFLF